MRKSRPVLCALTALLAVSWGAFASAAEFKGRVLDRDTKQPVASVIVQVFSMIPLGPDNQRVVASGYTNAKGQFLVPVPAGIDAGNLSLMVTRKAATTRTVSQGGQGLTMTTFSSILAMQAHPSLKSDNVLYANMSPPKKRTRQAPKQ